MQVKDRWTLLSKYRTTSNLVESFLDLHLLERSELGYWFFDNFLLNRDMMPFPLSSTWMFTRTVLASWCVVWSLKRCKVKVLSLISLLNGRNNSNWISADVGGPFSNLLRCALSTFHLCKWSVICLLWCIVESKGLWKKGWKASDINQRTCVQQHRGNDSSLFRY